MTTYKNTLIGFLFFIMLLIAPLASAYSQTRPYQERLKTEKVAFFNKNLELTPDEAEKFWPLYNDYNSRKEKLNDESRLLMRFVNSNFDNMDDAEIRDHLSRYVEIQNKSHQLFLSYNDKFLQILPEAKVLKLYIVESQFKQFLLRQISNTRRERMGNRR